MVAVKEQVRSVLDAGTGEAMALVPIDSASSFSMQQYLTGIVSDEAVANQKALAVAYDKLCDALIGANDVHDAGDRKYKKKSAWLKLGRAFRLDTRIVSEKWVDVPVRGSYYEAERVITMCYVIVEVVAPWGQTVQAIGGAGYDEETPATEKESQFKPGETYISKGKELSLADIIATAQTRATNRAISTLIAMGEVSAEEMDKGRKYQQSDKPNGAPVSDVPDATALLGFGKHAKKTWREVATEHPDYLEFLLDSERKKNASDKFKKSPAWSAFVEGLLRGETGEGDDPTNVQDAHEEAVEADANVQSPPRALSQKQIDFAKQLAKSSALSSAARTWAGEKIELAINEQWLHARFSEFISLLQKTVDEAHEKRKARGESKEGDPAATDTAPGAPSAAKSSGAAAAPTKDFESPMTNDDDDDLPF